LEKVATESDESAAKRVAESSEVAGVLPAVLFRYTRALEEGAVTTVRLVGREIDLATESFAEGIVPTVPARMAETLPVTLAA